MTLFSWWSWYYVGFSECLGWTWRAPDRSAQWEKKYTRGVISHPCVCSQAAQASCRATPRLCTVIVRFWAFRGDRAGQSLPHASTKSHPPLARIADRPHPMGLNSTSLFSVWSHNVASWAALHKKTNQLRCSKEERNKKNFLPSVCSRYSIA